MAARIPIFLRKLVDEGDGDPKPKLVPSTAPAVPPAAADVLGRVGPKQYPAPDTPLPNNVIKGLTQQEYDRDLPPAPIAAFNRGARTALTQGPRAVVNALGHMADNPIGTMTDLAPVIGNLKGAYQGTREFGTNPALGGAMILGSLLPEGGAAEDVVRSLAAKVGDVGEREAAPAIREGLASATSRALPEQRGLPRYAGPRIPQSRLDDIEQASLDTYSSPQFERWLQSGNFADWYHTEATRQKAIDALGPEAGQAAFEDLMNKMGATTARSAPPNNLRRASYYYGMDRAGLLDPEALRAGVYKDVPAGMGHLANNAHHAALASLAEHGSLDPIANPKPASFVENLTMNFRPYTHDTRMATGTALANPQLVDDPALRAIVQSTARNKETGAIATTYSPRDLAYDPMERAFQRQSQDWASRGLLDVPAGADPTAYAQAKIWDGLARVLPGASPSSGTFNDVFDRMLSRSANDWGVPVHEANRLIWQGHPFDLPLNANLIPRRLNR